jgi:CHASE3 domain sensor protein
MKTRILKIAQKVVLPTIVMSLFLLGFIAFAEFGLNAMGGLTTTVIDRNAERTVLALSALDNVNLATIKEKNALLEKGDEAFARNTGEYDALMESALERLDQLKLITDADDLDALLPVIDLAARYKKLTEETVFPLVKEGNIAKASELSFSNDAGGGRELRQDMRAKLEAIIESDRQEMRAFGLEVRTTSERTKNILILIAACALATALVWISALQIMGGKNKLSGLEKRANGNLGIEIDEAGRENEVKAVIRALEMFKENAGKARRQAEEEENEYARKLAALRKDLD